MSIEIGLLSGIHAGAVTYHDKSIFPLSYLTTHAEGSVGLSRLPHRGGVAGLLFTGRPGDLNQLSVSPSGRVS